MVEGKVPSSSSNLSPLARRGVAAGAAGALPVSVGSAQIQSSPRALGPAQLPARASEGSGAGARNHTSDYSSVRVAHGGSQQSPDFAASRQPAVWEWGSRSLSPSASSRSTSALGLGASATAPGSQADLPGASAAQASGADGFSQPPRGQLMWAQMQEVESRLTKEFQNRLTELSADVNTSRSQMERLVEAEKKQRLSSMEELREELRAQQARAEREMRELHDRTAECRRLMKEASARMSRTGDQKDRPELRAARSMEAAEARHNELRADFEKSREELVSLAQEVQRVASQVATNTSSDLDERIAEAFAGEREMRSHELAELRRCCTAAAAAVAAFEGTVAEDTAPSPSLHDMSPVGTTVDLGEQSQSPKHAVDSALADSSCHQAVVAVQQFTDTMRDRLREEMVPHALADLEDRISAKLLEEQREVRKQLSAEIATLRDRIASVAAGHHQPEATVSEHERRIAEVSERSKNLSRKLQQVESEARTPRSWTPGSDRRRASPPSIPGPSTQVLPRGMQATLVAAVHAAAPGASTPATSDPFEEGNLRQWVESVDSQMYKLDSTLSADRLASEAAMDQIRKRADELEASTSAEISNLERRIDGLAEEHDERTTALAEVLSMLKAVQGLPEDPQDPLRCTSSQGSSLTASVCPMVPLPAIAEVDRDEEVQTDKACSQEIGKGDLKAHKETKPSVRKALMQPQEESSESAICASEQSLDTSYSFSCAELHPKAAVYVNPPAECTAPASSTTVEPKGPTRAAPQQAVVYAAPPAAHTAPPALVTAQPGEPAQAIPSEARSSRSITPMRRERFRKMAQIAVQGLVEPGMR
eukprot:gnl/TRDRNA2_/TRDRNA2_85150_c0_seq1.p1 gnl/TRDRNA2_/TRDRNA2_85150_c0~~gnl/TRDRNA2_/TRDRNA2_85150_c0_seq1.p1  ORF type:complete len:824 (-),score=164.01 gnl/TRDRNA2_/TRDRNA2_85150_c0_seq1:80-2551(-)